MTATYKNFQCTYTAEIIGVIEIEHLRQRNVPKGGFTFKIVLDGRSMLHVILTHGIKMADTLFDNLLTSDEENGFEKYRLFLPKIRGVCDSSFDKGRENSFYYRTHDR